MEPACCGKGGNSTGLTVAVFRQQRNWIKLLIGCHTGSVHSYMTGPVDIIYYGD
jgi:hypothetical protein